ncbi:MAG: sigma-E processing peptidase SpoIIGA [Bacillota bacterium]
MGEIFLDVYMIVNFTLNYALLYATALAAGRRTAAGRLVAASGLGSIYALGYLYPRLAPMYGVGGILLTAALMVMIAFHPLRGGRDVVLLLPFLGLAVFGGGAGLLLAGSAGAGAAAGMSAADLVIIAILILLSGYAIRRGRTRGEISPGLLAEVRVEVEGRSVTCRGLIDSGNRVVDPISGDPVIIVEYGVIRDLLPLGWRQMAAGLEGASWGDGPASSGGWDRRLRILPFRALQGSGGIMPGMRPDAVVIRGAAETRVTDVVIGITREALSDRGEYRALIPAHLSWGR